ncbi:MAG: TonB-dependent receptor [Acidobacteriota bacterium]|nr:TonB-dependent receptor [Acidobacteriota bacterium]
MRTLRFWTIALILLIVVNAATVFGQSDRGSIRGSVTDPSGAVVANAKVTLTGVETGQTRETTTNEEGTYVFPELPAAIYQVSVEAQGFQRTTVTDFKVAVQVTHTLDIQLQIGAATTEVTVNAEAEAINAETPVRQTNVTERQVKELPLQVGSEAGGRTPLSFIFLDSNVGAAETSGGTNASRFRVSGGQGSGTEILIDGASMRRTQNGTFFTEVAPGPNAFQEFTISTSTYSAEFGSSSGGIVNFTLKSGTNEFHGEVYDLIRNEALNANSLFNNATGLRRNRDNQNNYGFNIGGPIILPGFGEGVPPILNLRDRAFFFFNYEGYRFRRSNNALVTVPTARMRTGDFSELLTDPYVLQFFGGPVRIYNPRQAPNVRQALPGNIVPANLIDPAGFAILQRFPMPNRAGVFQNYQASVVVPNDSNQYTIKTDFNITSSQRLTVSYSRRDNERIANFAGAEPVFPLPFTSFDVWEQAFKSDIIRLQHDVSITPMLLNHFNFGYSHFDVANRNTTDPFNTSSLGIPVNATQNTAFPRIDFPGYGANDPRRLQNIGSTFFTDRIRDKTFQFSDFVTYVTGRHTFKAGADIRTSKFKVRQKIDPGGAFNFRHDQTASDADPNGGYPVASLITGATEFAFNSNNSIDPIFNQLTQGYFIQDDIKVNQKLTLNVGVRYDIPGLRTEEDNRFRTFDPNVVNPAINRPGALVGAGGQSGLQAEHRALAPTDYSNIGPRVGAAYALDNKTVIRAGVGLYYAPVLYGTEGGGDINTGTIGYNTTGQLFTPNGRQAVNFLSSFPSIPQTNPNSQFVGDLGVPILYFGKNFRTGRTLQYSVDLQRELPYKFVASIGYIGHRADRLRSSFSRINALPLNALRLGADILNTNINQVTALQRQYATSVGVNIPATGNAVYNGFNGNVAQALRPFPQYGRITDILESEGESDYNALQLKLERRFAQGIQFGASYTYSRLVTNAAEDVLGGGPLGGILQNPFDTESLKTDSPTHSPHVFVTNFLVELPFGKGRRFLNQGGILNVLVGGWQVSGIFRYQQGTPLVFSLPTAPGGNFLEIAGYYGNLRPNLTGQAILAGNRTPVPGVPGRFYVLNPAAFSAPPNFGAAPAFLLNNQINSAYTAFYADPLRFFGNAPPVITDVRSDPFFTEDMSLLKKTRITETITLELGAEFYNVFNRVRYLPPDTSLGAFVNGRFENSNFGAEGAANNPRVIQLRARVTF